MATDEKTRRNIVEKVALAAILVISLLAARLVVGLKSAILMSSLVELNRSGLFVSMPSGNGWQCDSKWIYDSDGFIIRSILSSEGMSQSYAQCHYLLASEQLNSKERFDKQAVEIEGEVTQTGQLPSKQLKVEWARIIRYADQRVSDETPEQRVAAFEIIFGVCALPGGRQLEIEVLAPEEGKELVWKVFERIVKDIKFGDNGLLQAGAEIVSGVKRGGMNGLFADESSRENGLVNLFIIQNPRGRSIGFTMDVIVAKTAAAPAVKAANYFYLQGPITYEEIGLYGGDSSFEQFNWKVRINSQRSDKIVEIECKNGLLTSHSATTSRSGEKEKEYVPGNAAIPDIVIEPFLKKLLDSPRKEIIIDVIRADGTITPVYLRKMEPSKGGQSYADALRVELLDGRGYWQQIYYDDTNRPMKIMLGQESIYTLQRATAVQIAEAFPQRADIVRDPNQLLNKDI